MKFDHAVKHNGIMYVAGAEVPADDSVSSKSEKITRSDYESLKESHEQLARKLEEAENTVSERYKENAALTEENAQLKAELEHLKGASVSDAPNDEHEYKKSEISRMGVDDLRALAAGIGIEVTEEITGAKLKEAIIDKLGL